MPCDRAGQALTASADAAAAYNAGVERLLRLDRGAVAAFAQSIALDPTFSLGHAALAVLGHELCAPVDIGARVHDARLHARRATERERRHVHAVERHLSGDSAPLLAHLDAYPGEALLLSIAVPTIAFSGVTTVPAQAWDLVERCRPAYGEDWWFAGLLAFMRQEQGRFDEAMDLSCRSLTAEPAAGHAAHARAHAHYETGDHTTGVAWMHDWIHGAGAGTDNLLHFSWHAALHELSMGDLGAVRRRYDAELRPTPDLGCRTLVDSASLLWRWALTPGCHDVPSIDDVLAVVEPGLLSRPPTAFMALHAAVALCAADDAAGLATLERSCRTAADPAVAEIGPAVAGALHRMVTGDPSGAADDLGRLEPALWKAGGSDAQREVIEETRICALVRAGRRTEAIALIDRRLDRRHCRRDEWLRADAAQAVG